MDENLHTDTAPAAAAPLPNVEAAAPPPADSADVRTVLCVDDETHILSSLRRALRAAGLPVLTAGGGEEALALLAAQPVAVIVSDMRMPGMDGAQLLEQVRLRHPDTVRVLLTGQADQRDTIAAINRGSLFRYLHKPWNDDELKHVLQQALELRALEFDRRRLEALAQQHNEALRQNNALLEARVAERTADLAQALEDLRRTHMTSLQVFASLIEMRGGWLTGHSRRVADIARRIGKAMGCSDVDLQHLLVASLLHDIGLIALPDTVLRKPVARFGDEEMQLYRQHPAAGEQALMALESLQPAAALIRAHHERFDGQGFPDGRRGNAIPLLARILAVADTFDDLQQGVLVEVHASVAEARALVQRARGLQFDPEVVDVFLHITEPERSSKPVRPLLLGTAQLQPRMVLAADLLSPRGQLMLTAGQVLTERLIQRIREFEVRYPVPLQLQIQRRSGENP